MAVARVLHLADLPWRIHAFAIRNGLTEREEQIFALAVVGLRSTYEFAEVLQISINTVKSQIGTLLKRIEARNLPDAVNAFFYAEWPGGGL